MMHLHPALALPVFLILFAFTAFAVEPSEEEVIEGEGITVVGTQETTQQIKSVTKDEIEKSNAPDLATLLQETLNLGVTTYGGYGMQTDINLRGFDSERIAFLVDGIPQNSPASGDFDINSIDLSSVERIEVIYGGSDTKYNVSGALGGVVNIITVKKLVPGLHLSAGISNTSQLPGKYRNKDGEPEDAHYEDLVDAQNYTLTAGYGAETFSVKGSVFANNAGNHFLYKDYRDDTRRKVHNEVWDIGGALSGVFDLPDGYSTLIASGTIRYSDKNIPTSGFSYVYGAQTDFSARQNVMLNMPRAWHDDLAMEASLSYNFGDTNYEVGNSLSNHTLNGITVVNRWTWYALDVLALKAGGDYRFCLLDSGEMGIHDRHDGGVYLTAEYQPHKKLLIIPSVKAVFGGTSGSAVVPVPKLGLLWKAADWVTLKNNYFRSFKLPDLEDLYWIDGINTGNPALKPEDGWGADLGASFVYKESVKVDTTGFAQWTSDSIHWYNSTGKWQPENVGEAVFFGSDTTVRFAFPLPGGIIDKIKVSASYQYLLSYLLSYGYTWASGKRIPYSPEHTVGGSIELLWKSGTKGAGSFTLSGHYESLRYHDTSNLIALDHTFLLSAHINQKIGKNLTAFAVARNILDTSYQSFYDYPMPGFNFTLGMRFSTTAKVNKAN